MKFKTIGAEELETLPFDDIAYIILKEKGKKMKIVDIFKIICKTLNLGEEAFENQIGDFFSLMSTEKRFIQLEKGYWDLRENHTAEISIKEIEDELDDEIIPEEEKEEDEEEETDYYDGAGTEYVFSFKKPVGKYSAEIRLDDGNYYAVSQAQSLGEVQRRTKELRDKVFFQIQK